MNPPPTTDFSRYEPAYPELFALLRKAGWHPRRFVDFPRVDLDANGEPYGFLVLEAYPEAFLHSFYGLEVAAQQSFGEVRISIGFGERWERMRYEEYGINIDALAGYAFPYPAFGWETMMGFVTSDGRALAVDDTYQVFARANDPFQLMDEALFRRRAPGFEHGYLERQHIPLDYWRLVWDRPLEYHLPKYRAYAVTEGGSTEYVLECIEHPQLFAVRVPEIREMNGDLLVSYRRNDPQMSPSLAMNLIVVKLLDQFFEGAYRERVRRIHLKDIDTGKTAVLGWPSAPAS